MTMVPPPPTMGYNDREPLQFLTPGVYKMLFELERKRRLSLRKKIRKEKNRINYRRKRIELLVLFRREGMRSNIKRKRCLKNG